MYSDITKLQYTYDGEIYAPLSDFDTSTLQYTYDGEIWTGVQPDSVAASFVPILCWFF